MKPEERLFDLIGTLPDDLANQTDAPQKARRKITPQQRKRWIGIAVAACLVIAVGVWGMTESPAYTKDDYSTSTPAIGLPGPKLNWPIPSGNTSLIDLRITMHPVGERLAEYHQVENPRGISKEQRPLYLGDPYLDLEDWYLPANTSELRYLIHEEEDGSYTLWEFSNFVVYNEERLEELKHNVEQGELTHLAEFIDRDYSPYSYGEVLETIYGITSAEDIRSVTVNPATMDNTDKGKKLQKQIGTHAVWKQEELEAFYQALSSSVCYGSDNWELIDLGDNGGEDGLLNSVRLCRYLTIELSNGATIDTLKYSAAGGQFYEYSGIAYEPLDTETAAAMNRMFQIEYPE